MYCCTDALTCDCYTDMFKWEANGAWSFIDLLARTFVVAFAIADVAHLPLFRIAFHYLWCILPNFLIGLGRVSRL